MSTLLGCSEHVSPEHKRTRVGQHPAGTPVRGGANALGAAFMLTDEALEQ